MLPGPTIFRKCSACAGLILQHTLDPKDRIMKAEIFRELGQFADAMGLLSGSFDEEMSQTVAIIKDLASKQDCLVKQM